MGDPESAVTAALLALADLVDVERYQEDPHLAELNELRGITLQLPHVSRRILEISNDHGYRKGWNTRSAIIAKRIRDIAAALDAPPPVTVHLDEIDDVNALPAHASRAW